MPNAQDRKGKNLLMWHGHLAHDSRQAAHATLVPTIADNTNPKEILRLGGSPDSSGNGVRWMVSEAE